MAIDLCKARNYVYRSGTLFERALFAWLFDAGSLERLHQIILCYKNPDAGFGHGFEHDLKAPQSNPLALEYLLGVMKHTSIPPRRASRRRRRLGRKPDGCRPASCAIRPKSAIIPLAPWWQEWGGQTMPDAIVGNLIHFGFATPSLIEKTKA